LAQHNKVLWFEEHGKWCSGAGKVHGLIWGDLSEEQPCSYGSLTEGYRERDRQPTEPYGHACSRARDLARRPGTEVSRGHSSQRPIVMVGIRRRAKHNRIRRSHDKLSHGEEPEWGRSGLAWKHATSLRGECHGASLSA
jgi:hypothetical protein